MEVGSGKARAPGESERSADNFVSFAGAVKAKWYRALGAVGCLESVALGGSRTRPVHQEIPCLARLTIALPTSDHASWW